MNKDDKAREKELDKLRTFCKCGHRADEPHRSTCETCESKSKLPHRYFIWEHYQKDPLYSTPGIPHYNATENPRTGNNLLDTEKIKFSQINIKPCEAKSKCEQERNQGLDDDI